MTEIRAVANTNIGELTDLSGIKNSIFLAGPCPRENYEDDWRTEAIDIIKNLGFSGNVLNPTNPLFKTIDLEKQTQWEREAMYKASAIVFWIPRSKEHIALTTNIELGYWIRKNNIFVGFPEDSIKNEYVGILSNKEGKKPYNNLFDMLYDVVEKLENNNPTYYFTSDTHFGQERTLELSRRPFLSVQDMDFNLISNWNKKITMKDNVIHCGDFGNLDILNILNFNTLTLIEGNYEERDRELVLEKIKQFPNVTYISNDDFSFYDNTHKEIFKCRHEPLKGVLDPNSFYLYGHIHGRDAYKRNGADVGVDSIFGRFEPYSLEEVKWMKEACLKYVDENVFCEECF